MHMPGEALPTANNFDLSLEIEPIERARTISEGDLVCEAFSRFKKELGLDKDPSLSNDETRLVNYFDQPDIGVTASIRIRKDGRRVLSFGSRGRPTQVSLTKTRQSRDK